MVWLYNYFHLYSLAIARIINTLALKWWSKHEGKREEEGNKEKEERKRRRN